MYIFVECSVGTTQPGRPEPWSWAPPLSWAPKLDP